MIRCVGLSPRLLGPCALRRAAHIAALCRAPGAVPAAPRARGVPQTAKIAASATPLGVTMNAASTERPANGNGAREEPSGVEAETVMLEGFCEIPTISKAWCMPSSIGGCDIQVLFNQRDLANNAMRRFVSTVHIPVSVIVGAAPTMIPSLPWQLRPDVVLVSPSPSGCRMLVVRQSDGPGKDKEPTILEIWGGGRLLKEVEVPRSVHRGVFNDGWFADGAAWSPDESRVCYVAEAPAAEKTPEWGAFTAGSRSVGGEAKGRAKPKTWRGKGKWDQDWGEAYHRRGIPRLFVMDLASWEVEAVPGIDPDLSCGQPLWSPDGESIVFVGWPGKPLNYFTVKQLGIIYCMNRPSRLYALAMPSKHPHANTRGGGKTETEVAKTGAGAPTNTTTTNTSNATGGTSGSGGSGGTGGAGATTANAVTTEPPACVCLTQGLLSAHSPRFTPDGAVVIFLSHEAAAQTGTHDGTAALRRISWSDPTDPRVGPAVPTEIRTMIGVVDKPNTGEDFPGLYTTTLPAAPFLADGHTIVLHSQWRSDQAIVTVDTMTGTITRITPPPPNCGSWRLLDVRHDVLVAAVSTPATPEKLMVARQCNGTWIWEGIQVAMPEPFHPAVEGALADMEYRVIQVPFEDATVADADASGGVLLSTPALPSDDPSSPSPSAIEAIIIRRRSIHGPAPTVLVPHGGPHAAFVTSFVTYYAFLAAAGYAVVLVNFRGSTGFGEAVVQALPGHIGEMDVRVCLSALDLAASMGIVDLSRVAVSGGSHGGFLAGHLLGRHGNRFKCGVMRNPVCNVALMSGISDIPDWCFVEVFGTEEGRRRFRVDPTVSDLERMHAASPIAHVADVRAPVLMLLGSQDMRVPCKDAMQYVTALRDREDPVEVRVLLFEDKHDLAIPQTEFESYINVAAWLKQYM